MHTSPVVEVTADRKPDYNGWYNHDVNINFLAYQTGELLENNRQKLVSTEGINQPITFSVTDRFGLTTQGSVNINLDKTPPVTTTSITEKK